MEEVAVVPPDVPRPKGRPRGGTNKKKKTTGYWPFKRDLSEVLDMDDLDYDAWTAELMDKHKEVTEFRARIRRDR